MDGTPLYRRALRSLAFAAALVLPASASAPAAAGDGPADRFTASFVDIAAASTVFVPAPQAVDIASIAPAVEDESKGHDIGGGVASFYGRAFAGRRTASGETFDPGQLTAAHRTLPFGSHVRVTNPANGRSVVVRINDRGPFHGGRVIDLSRSAAEAVGLVARGSGRVELALLD
jgi:rare lipoprotein A